MRQFVVAFDKTRREFIEESQHVFGHQNLAVAGGGRTNADGRDVHGGRNFAGQWLEGSFDDNCEGAGAP
jgi:hypothetical protein